VRLRQPESCPRRAEDVVCDSGFRALAIEDHPVLVRRLTLIARANAAEQREITFIAIPVHRLALRRGFRSDVTDLFTTSFGLRRLASRAATANCTTH